MEYKTTKAKKILNSILSLYLRTLSRGRPLKNFFEYLMHTYKAQSFTSLMADICKDIKIFFLHLEGSLMEHFLEKIAPLRHWYILIQMT